MRSFVEYSSLLLLGVTFASSARAQKAPVAEEKVVLEEDSDDVPPAPAPRPPRPLTSTSRTRAAWLQLGLMQDLTFVSGSDVCSRQSQLDGGFTCVRPKGSQYHGTPLAGSAGDAGSPGLAATRVSLAAAFPLGGGPFSLGLRVAYVIAGQGPEPDGGKKFFPLHLEAQGHYWFTGKAFSSESVGAFVVLSGGLAQVDASNEVTVRENAAVPPPVSQLDNPPTQKLDAWRKSGLGFAGSGLGVFVPVTDGFGFLGDLRASVLFPDPGFAVGLSLSAALGL